MQISLAPSRFIVPRAFNLEAFRAWFGTITLSFLKIFILLTITHDPLGAQALANRLWIGCVILIFWREIRSIIQRPNLYLIAIFFWILLGIVSQNPLNDMIADVTVMVLPAIFWRQLCIGGANDGAGYRDFCVGYFNLNVLGVFAFSLVALVLPIGVGMDWNFLIPALLSKVFTSAYVVDSFFFLFLFAACSVLSLSSKTAMGNIIIAAAAMTRGRLIPILVGLLLAGLVIAITLPFVMESQAGAKLLKLINGSNFTRLFNFPIARLVLNPVSIFRFLDISTAERLFELFSAIKKVSDSWVHILFGYGMGAGLDLSNSHDKSVLGSHDNTQDIRVVHLAITWALLKGGVLGLGMYIAGFIWTIWQAVINIRSTKLYFDHRWVWLGSIVALLVLFSMQFAVSVFIKTPTLAIGLMGLVLGRKLRKERGWQ